MTIYDGHEGGIGYAMKAFFNFPNIIAYTYEAVRQCKCSNGCPFCIMNSSCGSSNQHFDKAASLIILQYLLERIGKNG